MIDKDGIFIGIDLGHKVNEMVTERQDHFEGHAPLIWRTVKKHIGLKTRERCPRISVCPRKSRSSWSRRNGVTLGQHANLGTLVHELLHAAMYMNGSIKRMADGRRAFHSNRMRVLERRVCKELGIPISIWASGEVYSIAHQVRRETLKLAINSKCECGGQLEKAGAIPAFGTSLVCNSCGKVVWI